MFDGVCQITPLTSVQSSTNHHTLPKQFFSGATPVAHNTPACSPDYGGEPKRGERKSKIVPSNGTAIGRCRCTSSQPVIESARQFQSHVWHLSYRHKDHVALQMSIPHVGIHFQIGAPEVSGWHNIIAACSAMTTIFCHVYTSAVLRMRLSWSRNQSQV